MSVLSTGSTLGDFKVEDEVGRGGMGVVYRAVQISLGRPVALKVIAGSLSDNVAFRDRFVRESRLTASLDHPNVIPVFAAGETDGVLYIAMRYVDGTDLRSLVAAEGKLDPLRAAGVIAQVASALDAAHERGLVHRDVKPANILVAARGGGEHVYLTDFGLTKRSASESGLTSAGEWVGTLDYVAPEQLRGDHVDGRADVYALGAVLYETLTGQVPFPRDDDVAKLWAHISDSPPVATDLAPDVPRRLAGVARRAMEKDAEDRFDSASDMGRAALAAVPGGGDTGARARLAAGRTRLPRAPRRRRLWVGLLAVAGVAAAAVAAVLLLGSEESTNGDAATAGNALPPGPAGGTDRRSPDPGRRRAGCGCCWGRWHLGRQHRVGVRHLHQCPAAAASGIEFPSARIRRPSPLGPPRYGWRISATGRSRRSTSTRAVSPKRFRSAPRRSTSRPRADSSGFPPRTTVC